VQSHHYVHVVDDDEASRASVSFLLGTLGLKCLEYRSGKEFLDCFAMRPAGCILLDLIMPGMNGLEVQAELARRGVGWPVLFMSGHASTPAVVEAVRGGAVEFLLKPFGEEELLVALHHGFAALNRQCEPLQVVALRA
jgi:two-component system, LuxR family, response regulator FixJ